MGIFDFLSKKTKDDTPKRASQRELQRLARLVGSKLSQNYDRQEAIESLAKMGTQESAGVLLKRFDWTLDPSITDQEEKEAATRGIIAAGDAALEPIRDYCKRAESLTWPIKVLKQILDGPDLVDELLGVLDEFDTEYVRNSEPKVQLLNTLEEFPSPEVREAVEPFLLDMSEPVRFAAVTTVFAMENTDSVGALVEAMAEEESLRVKNRIASGLIEREWEVPGDKLETCRKALPEGFDLNGNKLRPA